MRKPALLPDRILGMMSQDLDAALRHGAALNARHREGGGRGTCFGIDRSPEMHKRAERKARGAEPRVRIGGVRNPEGGKVEARIARHRDVAPAWERPRCCPEQHFDVPAGNPAANIT